MRKLVSLFCALSIVTFALACGDAAGPQPIASGAWNASTTGMSLQFTVNAAADGITDIAYTFSGLQCGGTTLSSGTITASQTPAWPIVNRQFQITQSSAPTIDITGTFGDDGITVSGTWDWLTCSGTWTGSH